GLEGHRLESVAERLQELGLGVGSARQVAARHAVFNLNLHEVVSSLSLRRRRTYGERGVPPAPRRGAPRLPCPYGAPSHTRGASCTARCGSAPAGSPRR